MEDRPSAKVKKKDKLGRQRTVQIARGSLGSQGTSAAGSSRRSDEDSTGRGSSGAAEGQQPLRSSKGSYEKVAQRMRHSRKTAGKYGNKWLASVNATFGRLDKSTIRKRSTVMGGARRRLMTHGATTDGLTFDDGTWSVASIASEAIEEYEAPDLDEILAESALNLMRRAFSKQVPTEPGEPEELKWRSLLRTGTEEMGVLGLGVKLYFVMLKYFGLLFVIMSLCVVPNMYLFSVGGMVDEPDSAAKHNLGLLTVANFGTCPNGGCVTHEQTLERCLLPLEEGAEDCSLKASDAAPYVGYFDAAALLCYILCGWLLNTVIIPAASNRKSSVARISKYTAMVYELPGYLDGEEALRNMIWGVGKDHRVLLDCLGQPGAAWRDLGITLSGGEMPEEGGGPQRLSSVALDDDKLYGVGEDGVVYRTVHRLQSSEWVACSRAQPRVSSIGIYEGYIYGIGEDQCIHREALTSMDQRWTKVSAPGVKCMTFHNGMVFAAGLDGTILVQSVDEMTEKTSWLRWAPGDRIFRCSRGRCCRRAPKPEPLHVRSLAIAGTRIYSVGVDGMLRSQCLDNMRLDENAWRIEGRSEKLLSIYIHKERCQKQYAHKLGEHLRKVLIEKEKRERGKGWRGNATRLMKAGRDNFQNLREKAGGGGRDAETVSSGSRKRGSMLDMMKNAGQQVYSKGLLLQNLLWKNPDDTFISKYEVDLVLDRRGGEELGFKVAHLEDSLLIVEAREENEAEDDPNYEMGIKTGSLLDMWNLQHPNRRVFPGHRIVEVNGLENCPGRMMTELQENTLLAIKVDKAVREVVVVRDNGSTVEHFIKSGKLQQDIENMRVRIQHACHEEDDKAIRSRTKQLQKLLERSDKLMQNLKAQAQLLDECKDVCLAFVTFSSQQVQQQLLQEYRYSAYSWWRPGQQGYLRFHGTPLMVVPAPDAGDLYWENLDYSRRKRTIRKLLMRVFTVVVLLVCSSLIAIGMNAGKLSETAIKKPIWIVANTAGSTAGCLKFCSMNLYGDGSCNAASVYEEEKHIKRIFDNRGAVNTTEHLTGICPEGLWESAGCDPLVNGAKDWVAVEFLENSSVQCLQLTQNGTGAAGALRIYACDSVPADDELGDWHPNRTCTPFQEVAPRKVGTTGAATVLSGSLPVLVDTTCVLNNPNATILFKDAEAVFLRDKDNYQDPTLNCFCMQQLAKNPSLLIPPYNLPEQQVCTTWILAKTSELTLLGVGICSIVIVNQVLLIIYGMLIDAEKHFTETSAATSSFRKIFISMFVNTSLLTYFVNARIGGFDNAFTTIVALGQGSHFEPGKDWFLVVGLSMSFTIFLLPLSNTLPQVLFVLSEKLCILPYIMSKSVTKAWAFEHYVLPKWNLPIRLAQTLNAICVIMMYSPGMPVLFFVGVAYCFMAFWIDKWMLLRGTSRPPVYSKEVVDAAQDWWGLGAFLHAFFATLTFSNQTLMPSEWNFFVRDWAAWLAGQPAWDEGGKEFYEDTREAWLADSVVERDKLYWDYIATRIYDSGRMGTWVVSVIFWWFLIYLVLTQSYTKLLKPIFSPFLVVIRHWCGERMKRSALIRRIEGCIKCLTNNNVRDPFGLRGLDVQYAPPLQQMIKLMEADGYLTSYRMNMNENYNLASIALDKYQEDTKNKSWIGGFARKHRDLRTFRRKGWWTAFKDLCRRTLTKDQYGNPDSVMYRGNNKGLEKMHKAVKFVGATRYLLAKQVAQGESPGRGRFTHMSTSASRARATE